MRTWKTTLTDEWIDGGWYTDLVNYLNSIGKDLIFFRSRHVYTNEKDFTKRGIFSRKVKKQVEAGLPMFGNYLITIYTQVAKNSGVLFKAVKIMKAVMIKKTTIGNVTGQKAIHCGFRPSIEDVIQLSSQNPDLQVIQIPKSYTNYLSNAIYAFCNHPKIGITVIEGTNWGHRTDLDVMIEMIVPGEKYQNLEDGSVVVIEGVSNAYIDYSFGTGKVYFLPRDLFEEKYKLIGTGN